LVLGFMRYNRPMSKKEPTQNQQSPVAPNSSVKVTIPWKTVKKSYEQVLTKAAKNVKADGFRQGKVPPTVAEKLLDQSKLYDLTLQEILPEAYTEALKEAKLSPISQPEIEPVQMEKEKDWVFTLSFATQPTITLGDYQKVTKKALAEAEKEVTETEKKLKEDAKKAEKDHKDHEGHTHPTELTAQQKDDVKMKHIFRGLVDSIHPTIPEILVRGEVNRELQRLADQLQQLRLSVDEYLKSRQMTMEQVRQEYAVMAVSSLQIEFILGAIAKDQKMNVEDKEIEETLDKVAGGKLTPAERQNPDYRSYIFSTLLKQKVMQFLLSL
jgi:FKBP-type peptidyl-prolyl cis-trans isomerase (trigger factor)